MRRTVALATAGLAAAVLSTSAAQAGCLTGAVVGGVAGHYAGHHPIIGAVGGCAVGHHMAVQKKRERAAQRAAVRRG